MNLTAALFVGGLSRRMGADKATLQVLGEPLWARQIKLLRELQPQCIVISARERPNWCPADIETISDQPPSRGPLSGLAAILKQLKTTHLLTLAIDLPRITSAELRNLWALAQPGCGVIPMSGQLFEPLCAIYPVEAAAIASDTLAEGDVSLQRFCRTLLRLGMAHAHPLTAAEAPLFLNVNTPEDLSTFTA